MSKTLALKTALHVMLVLAGVTVWFYMNRTQPAFWFRFKFYDHMDFIEPVLWPAYGFVFCTLAPSLLALGIELAWKWRRNRADGAAD